MINKFYDWWFNGKYVFPYGMWLFLILLIISGVFELSGNKIFAFFLRNFSLCLIGVITVFLAWWAQVKDGSNN